MKNSSIKNKADNISLVTSEDLFAGLSFPMRVESCIKMVEGRAKQFVNETSILLDLARNSASTYVSCEAENDTDICADLAELDIKIEEIARQTVEKLRELNT